MFRKAFSILILGLLVGMIGGVGYLYWQRQRSGFIPAPAEPAVTTLTARCTGGADPRIVVSWPARLSSIMKGLERSVDGGPWTPLFTGGRVPTTTGYQDTTAQPERVYRYRIVAPIYPEPVIVEVNTRPGNCK